MSVLTAFFKVKSLEILNVLFVLGIALYEVDVSTAIEQHAWSWGNKVIVHAHYGDTEFFLTAARHLEDANDLDWRRALDTFFKQLFTKRFSFLILVNELIISLFGLRLFFCNNLGISFFFQKFCGKIQKTSLLFDRIFDDFLVFSPKQWAKIILILTNSYYLTLFSCFIHKEYWSALETKFFLKKLEEFLSI